MNNQDIISIATDYVAPTYGRYELALTKGEGCYVWDSNGKKIFRLCFWFSCM